MKFPILSAFAFTFAGAPVACAEISTLEQVKDRDELFCGVNNGLVGFSAPDGNGNWSGFDVSFCKAVAAAVLGDAEKVRYFGTSGKNRFDFLNEGGVDLLSRNSTWTFGRENDLKLIFAGISYYDGQGFMVPKASGITTATELADASICVQPDTTTELNLEDYFTAHDMKYKPIPLDSSAEGEQKLLAGECDAYTTDVSGLASTRAAFANPQDYAILPDIISKEPFGPAVRQGDDEWASIIRWTLFALIAAEEYGVTSENLDELSASSSNPEVRRLLGESGDLGEMLGLDAGWAKRAIAASGNYGEIFAATIGEQTPIGLPRGLNAQYLNGGLLYSPPFR